MAEIYAFAALYNITAVIFTSTSDQYRIGTVPNNIVRTIVLHQEFLGSMSESEAEALEPFNAIKNSNVFVKMIQRIDFHCDVAKEFRPSYFIISGVMLRLNQVALVLGRNLVALLCPSEV